jgi:hypothetical protein
MSVGVRRQDKELKAKLDTLLQNNASAIRRILDEYGIPVVHVGEKDL